MPLLLEFINPFQLLEVSEPAVAPEAPEAAPPPPFNFLGLPRELRDLVYSFLLVPSQPIELAPLQREGSAIPHMEKCFPASWYDWHNSRQWYVDADKKKHRWGGYGGKEWHLHKYKTQIEPSLKLLRTSKQINDEASATFYGQEFRFSNAQGWHLLHRWLTLFGPKNQQLLRHITVIYPGITSLHNRRVLIAYDAPWPSLSPRHFFETLKLSPIPTYAKEVPMHWSDAQTKRLDEYAEWIQTSDPEQILRSLAKLRSLRFVLFQPGDGHKFSPFYDPPKYRVRAFKWTASPNLKISFINLISVYGGTSLEVSSSVVHDFWKHPRLANHFYPEQSAERYLGQAKKFFEGMKRDGWEIEDVFYDNHYTYPGAEKEHCVDKEICEFKGKKWPFSCGVWTDAKPLDDN